MNNTTQKQGRGQITEQVKEKSKELFGFALTRSELRLLPYIQYTMMNSQKFKLETMNSDDFSALSKFRNLGYITEGVTESGRPMVSEGSKLRITKEFWTKLNELMWMSYVDIG